MNRVEILPGVSLNHLQSTKFKTCCMSVSLLTQLTKETASINALIPFVLRRGTRTYRTMESLSNRFDELYGTIIEPCVRKAGEIQSVGLYASFPEDCFLPEGAAVLKDAIDLVAEMLLDPATRGGLLLSQYVDSEKDNLCDIIRSRINNKRSYSLTRCIEEMCCYEDFAVGRYGSVESCETINYKKLTRQYHDLIQTCPVEIFICSRESTDHLVSLLKRAFCTMPRGEINYDIGTDIRMNSILPEPRVHEETMDVTQGQLVLGYRLGECMEDLDLPAVLVFNAVFGSGVTSKLFMNVREKLSLCYYSYSTIERCKGLMFVLSGIDFEKYEEAKAEILHQLDEVIHGNISEDELSWAKAGVASDLSALTDNQHDLEAFYSRAIVEGASYQPDELSCLVGDVSKEDVIRIAKSVELDMIYFLKGAEEHDDDED